MRARSSTAPATLAHAGDRPVLASLFDHLERDIRALTLVLRGALKIMLCRGRNRTERNPRKEDAA